MTWDTAFSRDAFGVDDVSAPIVSSLDPAPGEDIRPTQAFFFRVSDETLLETIVEVWQNGSWEKVHDGVAFVQPYLQSARFDSSTIETRSHRFEVRRTGGWVNSPIVRAYARDCQPNEATQLA